MADKKDKINIDAKTDENAKKSQFYVKAIIFVAVVIIAVASIWVIDNWQKEDEKAKIHKLQQESFDNYLDSVADSAGQAKDKLNKNLVGTYKSYGYDNEAVIELHEDCTISVVSTGAKGWWTSTVKNGIEIVAMMFEGGSNPEYFQVYGNRFLDTRSIYTGKVSFEGNFNSEFTMGEMKISVKDNGKVEGRFTQTVTEDGTEYPYSEAYGGSYTLDSEFIEITLGGEKTRFLMFDYGENAPLSGIASLYYEKLD